MSIDRAAFERLVEDNLGRTLAFAIRLCGEADAAEDIVQEALLRASRGWRSFRGESSFRTWLHRIVVNVYRDRERLARRRKPEPLGEDRGDNRAMDPAQIASTHELEQRVVLAINRLPPQQRAVTVLVIIEKLSVTEAAEWMGISPQNVRTNLHYARNKLRACLQQDVRTAPDGNQART